MSNLPTPPDEIVVLVSADDVTGERGWAETLQKRAAALVEVRLDPEVLERRMAGFVGMTKHLFAQADGQTQGESTAPSGTPSRVQIS